MATKVIGIECAYSSSVVEIPTSEKYTIAVGDEVIFKDPEDKEEYGMIKYIGRDATYEDRVAFNSKVLRKATPNDIQKVDSHIELSRAALKKCKEVVAKLGLEMNVFSCGYSLDGMRVQFMFTAEDRIDFRELVKDLAKVLQKQIHLRQIGPRDKAKMIGGYGKCGRPLCCSTWLGRLESIGMEMVRVQALESKGSSKLSGSCGKLLCCLKYEVESYKELRKTVPRIGLIVRVKKTSQEGMVVAVDILNQKVKVAIKGADSVVTEASGVEKVSS
ncbi:MAG: regulatory iron-sulfur-containing complex subunit RicT [Patescibacteria group bacterium]